MSRSIAVIGVGNMAKAIISGIVESSLDVSSFYLYDTNPLTFQYLKNSPKFVFSGSIEEAVASADCVLISVKPQNYPEVLERLRNIEGASEKLYISIAAGIGAKSVCDALLGATVVRVLPNLPMTVSKGLSVICRNDAADAEDFCFVERIFECAGSTLVIDESEMNRIIGVTSSSPAYVFKFADAICKGAELQGLDGAALLDAVCDVIIGSAYLLKTSGASPSELISRVASKGGTTQKALDMLDENNFDEAIAKAMIACTARAEELGK